MQYVSVPFEESGDYVQRTHNPYAIIEVHLDEQGNSKTSTPNFKCSIGCFFAVTVHIYDVHGEKILVEDASWQVNTTTVGRLQQTQERSEASFHGKDVGRSRGEPYFYFGWISPGEFTISVRAETSMGDIESQALISVLAPIVKELSFECEGKPEILRQTPQTNMLHFGLVKTKGLITTSSFPGIAGFIQFSPDKVKCPAETKTKSSRKQFFAPPQDLRTTYQIGRTSKIFSSQEHLKAFDQKAIEKVETLSFEINPASLQNMDTKAGTQYSTRKEFKTYVAFQPDAICAPGVYKTFVVVFNLQHLTWGCSATALHDPSFGWRLEDSEIHKELTTKDDEQWDVPLWEASDIDE